jgi:hypothetical protein
MRAQTTLFLSLAGLLPAGLAARGRQMTVRIWPALAPRSPATRPDEVNL